VIIWKDWHPVQARVREETQAGRNRQTGSWPLNVPGGHTWDYDLLPHIIHMGREGGSEVIWVLA
jgi:hypothetical protein